MCSADSWVRSPAPHTLPALIGSGPPCAPSPSFYSAGSWVRSPVSILLRWFLGTASRVRRTLPIIAPGLQCPPPPRPYSTLPAGRTPEAAPRCDQQKQVGDAEPRPPSTLPCRAHSRSRTAVRPKKSGYRRAAAIFNAPRKAHSRGRTAVRPKHKWVPPRRGHLQRPPQGAFPKPHHGATNTKQVGNAAPRPSSTPTPRRADS